MATNFYYVYSLKDPRTSPAKIFYVGKGTGSRAFDHLVKPDGTRKYSRIKQIQNAGIRPLVDVMIDNLDEVQALKLESELISALGTVDTGGLLENEVIPKGIVFSVRKSVTVPHGAIEKAQLGLRMMMSAIQELAEANPSGITNSDAASGLGLRSDYQGRQKDYLTYSVLGLLMRQKTITRKHGRPPRHVAQP